MIQSVTAGRPGTDILGTLLIVGKQEPDTHVDRAAVRVLRSTRITHQATGKPASFPDLRQGRRVEVRFAGPVAESYPIQGTAGAISVL